MKFCKTCNTDTERGNQGRCIPCTRAAQARYRKAHPDRTLNAQRRWRAKAAPKPRISQEEHNAQRREIYAATAEQRAAQKIEREEQLRRQASIDRWEADRLEFEANPSALYLNLGRQQTTESDMLAFYAAFRAGKTPEDLLRLDVLRLDTLARRNNGYSSFSYWQEQRYLLWAAKHPEQAAAAEQRALAAIAARDDYSDLV